MSKSKRRSDDAPRPQAHGGGSPDKSAAPEKVESVQLTDGDWKDRISVTRRAFPGPSDADAPLRVTFDRAAYAEYVAHAKDSLDAEICGVLVGAVGEDDRGLFVQIKAIIRGAAAREAGTHVTYTQETWTAIHKELDERYPKLAIVGWYHSHPGFGVEFSDMDVFIQENFFPGPTQIALVIDPLGGDEAICFNGPEKIEYLDRFWIEGRQRLCRKDRRQRAAAAGEDRGDATHSGEALGNIETRLNQLLGAIDRQQASYHRFLLTVGMLVATGVIFWIASTILHSLTASAAAYEPPKVRSYVPVPIKIGDKVVQLGVGIVDWKVPPELNAILVELEEKRQAEEAARAAEKEEADEETAEPKTPPAKPAAPKPKEEKGAG